MNTAKTLFAISTAALPVLLLLTAAKPANHPDRADRVRRGEYLVRCGGCADCHTPQKMGPNGPEPDTTRWLSGHPEGAKLPPPPALPQGPWFAVTAGLTAWSGPGASAIPPT